MEFTANMLARHIHNDPKIEKAEVFQRRQGKGREGVWTHIR